MSKDNVITDKHNEVDAINDDGENVANQSIDMQLGRIRCGVNIAYITVGIIFRERDDGNLELLLTQEAKQRCLGKWYIPAGRVEPGETILEGVIREVFEETGYKCEPEELINVQVQGSGWYRFSFYCNIIGGECKVTADTESLGANWFLMDEIKAKRVDLRASDFLKIVEEAERYREKRKQFDIKLSRFLPIPVSVDGLFIEFAILRTINQNIEILVHNNIPNDQTLIAMITSALPLVEFDLHHFFPMVVLNCFQQILINGRNVIEMPTELIQIQCLPIPKNGTKHGIRTRILCNLKLIHASSCEIRFPEKYHWIAVSIPILEQLNMAPGHYRPTISML
ncbi:putative nudix hydrolase [Dirofilaria immitis]